MDPIFKQFCMIITYLCTNYCRYFSFDTKILYFRIFYSSRNHLNHVYKVQSLYHKTSFWYLTTVYKLGQLALTGKSLSDCSLNCKFNTWKFQAQTWGEHVVYRNCFWHSELFLYSTCSPHVLQKEELLKKIYL